MSSFALGPLSNRDPQYQNQNTLVVDKDGRLRYAPISRRVLALPLEILAEIFSYCVPDEFITPSLTTAPLVLCGLCRQWREVAISTPELWSSLVLDMELAAEAEGYVDLYRTWLSRARRSPLSLHLQVEKRDLTKTVLSLLETIVALSPQWRNIHVFLTVDITGLLFERSAEGFLLLEKFTFTSDTSPSQTPISFCNAPRLREIDFDSAYPPVSPIHFPWAQITTFRTSDITVSSCLEILGNASNLVNGTFDFRSGAVPTISVLSLEYLQSLALSELLAGDRHKIPMNVLSCLKTPALNSLALQFSDVYASTYPQDLSPFLSFVSRSAFHLRSLALSLMPMTTDGLINCLKVVPSLVHLKLEPYVFLDVNTLFSQLAGDTTFLPKLESIHIFFSKNTGHYVSWPELAKMLRWRWDAVGITRLRSFQMAEAYRDDEEPIPDLKRLEEEGMDLYFEWARGDFDSFRASVGFSHLEFEVA
ncbi:hypothetical protein K438DRAFT_1818205 [Mycena galopus ATCC 62051]|nr:hypothetical protein K438DRAFT_1818205 [Mycena galopus ATCC 62051]